MGCCGLPSLWLFVLVFRLETRVFLSSVDKIHRCFEFVSMFVIFIAPFKEGWPDPSTRLVWPFYSVLSPLKFWVDLVSHSSLSCLFRFVEEPLSSCVVGAFGDWLVVRYTLWITTYSYWCISWSWSELISFWFCLRKPQQNPTFSRNLIYALSFVCGWNSMKHLLSLHANFLWSLRWFCVVWLAWHWRP